MRLDERRLAGRVGPEDGGHAAWRDGEIDAVAAPAARRTAFAKFADLDHRVLRMRGAGRRASPASATAGSRSAASSTLTNGAAQEDQRRLVALDEQGEEPHGPIGHVADAVAIQVVAAILVPVVVAKVVRRLPAVGRRRRSVLPRKSLPVNVASCVLAIELDRPAIVGEDVVVAR